MDREYEPSHTRSPATLTTHRDIVGPGRSSRSSLLHKSEHPVASGLVSQDTAQRDASQMTVADVLRSPGRPLDAAARASIEPQFGQDFSEVRIHDDGHAADSARALGARAYAYRNHIVFERGEYVPDTPAGRRLLGHELCHVIQSRGGPEVTDRVENPSSAAEAEAGRAGELARLGLPVGRVGAQVQGIALTPTSAAVEPLISHSLLDWEVTDADERAVLRLLRRDPDLSTTIGDLNAHGMLEALITCVDGDATRFEMIRLFGARLNATALALVQPYVDALGPEWQLQLNLGRLGVPSSGAPAFVRTPFSTLVSSDPSRPFTGAGATGINPMSQSIPVVDQILLASGDPATTASYSNPVGSLPGYLGTLTSSERAQQAELLLRQPISSVDAASYAGHLPSRAQVIEAAGTQHNLEPALIAAFILAEQRDQSGNEDAKDFAAADSTIMSGSSRGNTSIGLGQVVVSTASGNDLFQDLLSSEARSGLSRAEVARLLASDEYNIFATARYMRSVADDGSTMSIASLPRTQAAFPGIDLAAYAMHSSTWPEDNIRVLGSEYTSTPWDDILVPAWGDFVLEAYHDVTSSGVF